ncbi:hypothetical protein EMIHUDRAFT_433136, partial [Emiliania huxleyi CCMP1516]|uniref:Uncharacterized protein n=2 Tax=Emiliania huxleyi TaxID=2903 RepID=A0A0D3I242_EMIH1
DALRDGRLPRRQAQPRRVHRHVQRGAGGPLGGGAAAGPQGPLRLAPRQARAAHGEDGPHRHEARPARSLRVPAALRHGDARRLHRQARRQLQLRGWPRPALVADDGCLHPAGDRHRHGRLAAAARRCPHLLRLRRRGRDQCWPAPRPQRGAAEGPRQGDRGVHGEHRGGNLEDELKDVVELRHAQERQGVVARSHARDFAKRLLFQERARGAPRPRAAAPGLGRGAGRRPHQVSRQGARQQGSSRRRRLLLLGQRGGRPPRERRGGAHEQRRPLLVERVGHCGVGESETCGARPDQVSSRATSVGRGGIVGRLVLAAPLCL